MLIDSLTYAISYSGAVDTFWSKLDAGKDATLGVAASARPLMVAARFKKHPQPTLVVVGGEEAAEGFARSLANYLGYEQVFRFPENKTPLGKEIKSDPGITAQQLQASDLLSRGEKVVVVASARALLRKLPPASEKIHHPLSFKANADLADMDGMLKGSQFDDVARLLSEYGYENTGELEGPGSFCVRGGVIDVFPGNLTYPIRLDFFGDTLEEIKRIVPSTGQTISALDSANIYAVRPFFNTPALQKLARLKLERPARTNPYLRELLDALDGGLNFNDAEVLLPYLFDSLDTLNDYTNDHLLTCLIEPKSLLDDASHAYDALTQNFADTYLSVKDYYLDATALDFGGNLRASYLSLMHIGVHIDDELPVKRVNVAGSPDKLYARLKQLVDGDFAIVFSAPNYRARQDLKLTLVDANVPISEALDAESSFHKLKRKVVTITDAEIPLGMVLPKAKLALLGTSDTQGNAAIQPTRHIDITEISFPYAPGDYVVHAAHGIGHFNKLVQQDIDGVKHDYMLLEYAAGDKLYVPIEQLDRVTRYVGPEGEKPRLTRLNTTDWSRAMTRARKATKKLAFDLMDVYTRRSAVQGFRFSADTPWQREMEEAFPYQETPDQLSAIADVKADMQSGRPMDRLICGDVGFGKTEVALRAAFKATKDDKQVMVLCPTTILAQQHYNSFTQRFEPFGIRVDVLSRFQTPAEQKKALEDFSTGKLEVLVGTHRLLSRDVNPHDLGLIIIDEEQRFGVGHKEQLKNLRESIDVLTLSATPIPRTMQMSLSGVRDMSLILTPPDNRRPVSVHVGEWDPDVISGAIRRELARNGQVYYVSNRVRLIDEAVKRVQDAAGEARIGVAHGQMEREELEGVMEGFSAGLFDVLVATTIIESGIDNPNTNTLIIEDAQRLGLAQMYQLKGRVGRSSVQAYAYFMFPNTVPLTEKAVARLTALTEHQDLGSGIRIALRDLEIRGAGSMLGAEQHGNMSAVGFDLFAQMLATAVNAAREGITKDTEVLPAALSDLTVNLPGTALLPQDYIPAADERVMWYRRIASASTQELIDRIFAEMSKAHPNMPQEAINLFVKARIKAWAFAHKVSLISVVANKLVIAPIRISADTLKSLRPAHARWMPSNQKFQLPVSYFAVENDDELMEAILEFIQRDHLLA